MHVVHFVKLEMEWFKEKVLRYIYLKIIKMQKNAVQIFWQKWLVFQ